MKDELADSIEVTSATMSTEEMEVALGVKKPAAAEAEGADDQHEDEEHEPAATPAATPATTASDAGRVLADARSTKRIERLKGDTALYTDTLTRLGVRLPEFTARTYGKPTDEIDHLSRHRYELLEALNGHLKAKPPAPRPQAPAQPARQTVAETRPTPAPAPEAPKPFKFESWDEYQVSHPDAEFTEYSDARSDARDAHKEEQRRVQNETTQRETRQREEAARVEGEQSALERHVDAYEQANPGFNERLKTVDIGDEANPAFAIVKRLVRESGEKAGPILDYLAGHPEDATRLMGSRSAGEVVMTFGEISYAARLPKAQAPAEGQPAATRVPTARPSTNAPAPIARVPGTASPSQTLAQLADNDDDDADAFIATLDPKIFARAAGRPGR